MEVLIFMCAKVNKISEKWIKLKGYSISEDFFVVTYQNG